MNQEGIHLRRVFLHPAVRVEAIAVFPEKVGIAMNNPRIDAENGLDGVRVTLAPILTVRERCSTKELTPSAKYRPAMVIPPAGATR